MKVKLTNYKDTIISTHDKSWFILLLLLNTIYIVLISMSIEKTPPNTLKNNI